MLDYIMLIALLIFFVFGLILALFINLPGVVLTYLVLYLLPIPFLIMKLKSKGIKSVMIWIGYLMFWPFLIIIIGIVILDYWIEDVSREELDKTIRKVEQEK